MPAGIGGHGSSRGRHLGDDAARAFRTAPEKFSTYVSIAISLCNSGSNGISSSKWVWKLAQSVCLKSGRSGGDERMSNTQCQWEPGGGPNLVQSTKSDTTGLRGSWLSQCPGHQEKPRGCMGWWLWSTVQRSDINFPQHNHVEVSPECSLLGKLASFIPSSAVCSALPLAGWRSW